MSEFSAETPTANLGEAPFTPIFGDHAGYETYADIEAAVREQLPSAPRLLQTLIAGSALVIPEQWSYPERLPFYGKPEEQEAWHLGEELIAQRYSSTTAVPYAEIMPSNQDPKSNPRRDFWTAVEPYLDLLVEHQPGFITEDIVPKNRVLRAIITRQPKAEPVRHPAAHPKRVYKSDEVNGFMQRGEAESEAFWETAEVSQWESIAIDLDKKAQSGMTNIISGPRGIGKTNQLLPRLASLAEARGRRPITTNQIGPVQLVKTMLEDTNQPITLLLDEPNYKRFGGTAEILADFRGSGYDIETTIVFGGLEQARQRAELARSVYEEPLKRAGLRVNFQELSDRQELPLITADSIHQWGQKFGVESKLVDFIINQPYLRIPRVFDLVFHGVVLSPEYDPLDLRRHNYKYDRAFFLTQEYRRSLEDNYNPKRGNYQPRTMQELTDSLFAEAFTSTAQKQRIGRQIWLDTVPMLTGANGDASYQYYSQLCQSLGVKPAPEHLVTGERLF